MPGLAEAEELSMRVPAYKQIHMQPAQLCKSKHNVAVASSSSGTSSMATPLPETQSAAGGTSIEELAEKMPEKIVKIPIDKRKGISDEQCHQMVKGLGVQGDAKDAARQIGGLYELFIKNRLHHGGGRHPFV